MKNLAVCFGLCGFLSFVDYVNAYSDSKGTVSNPDVLISDSKVAVLKLGAHAVGNKFAPIVMDANAYIPGYNKDCETLYGVLKETKAFVQYTINETSGNITATLYFLNTVTPLNGGQWEPEPLPRIHGDLGGKTTNYSLTQVYSNYLPDEFIKMKVQAVKLGYIKNREPEWKKSESYISIIFPGPSNSIVPTQCYLTGRLY